MNKCGYADPRLRALADDELVGRERETVLRHVDSCGRCRSEFERIQVVAVLLQREDQRDDLDAPAHFTANLQVRLARHRRDAQRAGKPRLADRVRSFLAPRPAPAFGPRPMRLALSGVAATAVITALVCSFAFTRSINASEVARRAQQSWLRVNNYSCRFESVGVYQGQPRSFEQAQFFRRPGEFQLDTEQDYPLSTYVYDDRVIHYLPGGDWKGKGPLVIVRPRRESGDALPFPFGVTWNNGGNVSLDQIIRQLGQNRDAQVLGTEKIGERECYHLAFTAKPSVGAPPDRYELWIDQQTFLPHRISWYRDEANHIETTAKDLQVNTVLPAGTFEFPLPANAQVVYGDVDPHALALPILPKAPREIAREPVLGARYEGWIRSRAVSFPVFSPEWMPEGYELVRSRARAGRWVDLHWLRRGEDGRLHAIKLIQQDGSIGASDDFRGAMETDLGAGSSGGSALLMARKEPFANIAVTWRKGATRFSLYTANLDRTTVLKIAASITEVSMPAPVVTHIPRRRGAGAITAEPSLLPTEALATEPEPTVAVESAPDTSISEPPPMMPEMSDEDQRRDTVPARP